MKTCSKCKKDIKDSDKRIFETQILCEDCYIEKLAPKPGMKWSENDSAEFMRRLKTSYSVRKQQNQEFPEVWEE